MSMRKQPMGDIPVDSVFVEWLKWVGQAVTFFYHYFCEGTAHEEIKNLSVENPELSGSSFKAYSHACFT